MLGKPLSPITLATSEVAIYSYTYVDYATVHSYATSQVNHVFLKNQWNFPVLRQIDPYQCLFSHKIPYSFNGLDAIKKIFPSCLLGNRTWILSRIIYDS